MEYIISSVSSSKGDLQKERVNIKKEFWIMENSDYFWMLTFKSVESKKCKFLFLDDNSGSMIRMRRKISMMPSTLIQKCPQYVYSVFLFIRPSCLMPTLGQLFCLNFRGLRSVVCRADQQRDQKLRSATVNSVQSMRPKRLGVQFTSNRERGPSTIRIVKTGFQLYVVVY